MRRRIALVLAAVPLVLMLGWVAAGAAMAGGGCHGQDEATATEAATSVVKLDGCTYAPTITRIPIGTEVRWINASGQVHDVTGRRFEWGSNVLDNGASFTHRFTASGMYPYSCSFHPGMAGIVVVGAPDLTLTSDVQAPPVEPVASERGGDVVVPILAAAGLGLLGGAFLGSVVASRRRRVDPA